MNRVWRWHFVSRDAEEAMQEVTERCWIQREYLPEKLRNILILQIEMLPDKSKSVSVLCEGSITNVLGFSSSRVENGVDYIIGGRDGGKEPSKV